jgi:hypothetical protein
MSVSDHYDNIIYGIEYQSEGDNVSPHDDLAMPIEDAIKGFVKDQTRNLQWEVRWTRNLASIRIDLLAQTTINGKPYKTRTYNFICFKTLHKRIDPVMYLLLSVIECLEIIWRRMVLKFRTSSYHDDQQEVVGYMGEYVRSRKILDQKTMLK